MVVDAGSVWIEAFPAENRTSQTVKVRLSQIFARFGIPRTFVSDNGPEFVSSDLKQWCESLGIKKNDDSIVKIVKFLLLVLETTTDMR